MATVKQLRQFGLSLGFVVFFWQSIYFYFREEPLVLFSFGAYLPSASLLLLALIIPNSLRGLFHYWMLIVELLNKLLTWFTMSVVYFVIITPVALLRRVMGKSIVTSNKLENSTKKISKQIMKEDMEHPY